MKFVAENLPSLKPKDNVIHEFENYWTENKQKAEVSQFFMSVNF